MDDWAPYLLLPAGSSLDGATPDWWRDLQLLITDGKLHCLDNRTSSELSRDFLEVFQSNGTANFDGHFTGGGPVQAAGKLVTGSPAPDGLSPVTGTYSVTVGTAQATVKYIGLTPEAIGLYQVNFIVPQLPKGTYPVVINIEGHPSNSPVMTISN